MANEKYKFYGTDTNGDTKLLYTENYPNLESTTQQKMKALNAIVMIKGAEEGVRIDLTSDTTVYTAI